MSENCISDPISASSTDNYPGESIQNTLEPRDEVEDIASYWSSRGESDPSVPETLIYKLVPICVLLLKLSSTIPSMALIYVHLRLVRFRMGYPICRLKFDEDVRDDLLSAHQWRMMSLFGRIHCQNFRWLR